MLRIIIVLKDSLIQAHVKDTLYYGVNNNNDNNNNNNNKLTLTVTDMETFSGI
jgi:hypothetical protein